MHFWGKTTRFSIASIWLALVFAIFTATNVVATSLAWSTEIKSIRLGFDNHFRLGEWAPLEIYVDSKMGSLEVESFEIECTDGNEAPVVYRGKILHWDRDDSGLFGWFRLGRPSGNFTIRLFDAKNQKVAEKTLPLSGGDEKSRPSILSPTAKLILTIGVQSGKQNLFPLGSTFSNSSDATVIVNLQSPRQLPPIALGLQNIDTLVVSASREEITSEFTPMQLAAIREWVDGGGKLVFWVGQYTFSTLNPGGMFAEFCPGTYESTVTLTTASRLEFFVKAKQPLLGTENNGLIAAKIAAKDSLVMLQQDDNALILKRQLGFGQVVFSAIALDEQPMLDWEGTPKLIEQMLLQNRMGDERNANGPAKGRLGHVGYQDLTGQLRIPLEQFDSVQFISFTTVAILIGVLVLLVGPVDYFLLRGLCRKRMELTWVTFPIFVTSFCFIAVWLAQKSKSTEMQVNHLEILDFDSRTGHARGTAWSCIYSPTSGLRNVSGDVQPVVASNSVSNSRLTWLGRPGVGLGGMESQAGLNLDSTSYVNSESNSNGKTSLQLDQFPFPVGSTKAFQFEWQGKSQLDCQPRLKYELAIGRLSGSFRNPFDFPLRNCRVYYDTWAYVFDRTIETGDSVDMLTEARERTVKSILTQRDRATNAGKTQNVPWDPTETNVGRILEMIMFHQAAGGHGYTTLSNRYQSRLETSDHLELKQAILVAEIPRPFSQLLIDGKPLEAGSDKRYSVIRIFLPVEIVGEKK